MRKLVLFDIDGTLVLTGGAGLRAMNRAVEEVLGHSDVLNNIQVAGRTDWAILTDAAAAAGATLEASLLDELRRRYTTYLAGEIHHRGSGRKGVMPGVAELLPVLRDDGGVVLGLLTGNFEEGAKIKLAHFDLWDYFVCGAYGGDASDRNALVPVALSRARAACGLGAVAPSDIFVVGDTPHDVACAHAVGATPVAVATGGFTEDQLRASGAGIVFRDLGDTRAFLEVLEDR